MTATHPTDRELGDFLLGKLGDEGEVESHLAECESCRERAAGVEADDTFTELLAAARTRLDSIRASAPTPTLDGAATPPAFAPTLAWDGNTPGADATGLAVPAPLANHPKYRPIRRLGLGGMGTVWLAEHTVMNRPVAVKVIRPDLLARPGATGRFLREVRAAAKLHHPNIVTAFDAEPTGDSCLFVMEYVPGETLAERLAAGPMPLVEALKAVRDAARGLAHAHSHGLVHRDVKPHNLIRAADDTTKVLDFGLAGVGAGEAVAANGEGLTGAGMVVGTPDYIAPEQIADPHTADARADIYGLGCTLYHLLAGRSPMPDGSVMEKLNAQRERPMDPIPGLPAAVAAVLAKMTAKDPNERYQSADEVVIALERCIRMVEPVMRKRRRIITVAAGISLALFLAITAVVYKLERDNQVIEIKTDDPDIEILMKRKGEVVKIIDHKSHQEWTYDTLKNEIAQADTPDGLKLQLPDDQAVVFKRSGKDVFSVKRITTAVGLAPAPAPAVDPSAPRLVRTIDHRRPVRDIAWTPGGQSVVAVGGGLCRYDVVKGRSGFEYRYEVLSRLPGLKGNLNTEGPTQMALTDDGQTAVIVYGNTLGRFSLADGKALGFQQVRGPGDKPAVVTALAVSPDGRTAVCAAGEDLVFEELGKEGEPKSVKLTAPGPVVSLRYSPDSGFLVAAAARPDGSRTQLIIVDARTHQIVGRHDVAGMLGRLDISVDGKRLVAAGGVGDRGGFIILTHQVDQKETQLGGSVEAARLSADGKRLTLERAPGVVEVWDVERKVRVSDQPLPADPKSKAGDAPVRHVAISPDGRRVAVARGNEIGIWELPAPVNPDSREPGGLVHDIPWPKGEANVYYGTFSPDGKYVLAGTSVGDATSEVWETVSGKHVATLPFPAGATFLPDGKSVLGVEKSQELVLWDLTTNKEVRRFPPRQTSGWVSVSADSKRAVSYLSGDNTVAGGPVVVWDVATATPVAEIDPKIPGTYIARITPDGKRVVTVGFDSRVCLWDVADQKLLHEWHSAEGSVFGPVTFLADGKSFITTSDTQTRSRVARFDESANEPTFPWDDKTQGVMGASPDGRIALIYNGNRTVRAFDVVAGKELGSVDLPTKLHGYMAVSPDGKYGVATATSWQIHGPARVYVFRLPGTGK